jgi:hypothetical protein
MADETIFTMDSSSIKFGVGATREVGDDMQALALQSLRAAGIDAVLYDRVRVEPTDASFQDAIRFATEGNFDGYVAVGGGSSIDTAKRPICTRPIRQTSWPTSTRPLVGVSPYLVGSAADRRSDHRRAPAARRPAWLVRRMT